MSCIQVIYVQHPNPPLKVSPTSIEREVQSEPTVSDTYNFPAVGELVPHLFINGQQIGLLQKLEVVSSADRLRPVLRVEILMYGPEDQIIQMTSEQFDEWRKAHS
jgi:hypothetical protein